MSDYEDEEREALAAVRKHTDYDCGVCQAHNPCEKPLSNGDEVTCFYCGADFEVRLSEEGRLRLKEL